VGVLRGDRLFNGSIFGKIAYITDDRRLST
jgi:hypothetical protein